jgi:endonuclease-8
MHEALAGRVLTRSHFRVPRLAAADLRGRTVIEVRSRGKHMLTRIEGGLTLHTHFRMDGTWRLTRPGHRVRGVPDWQVRVVIGNPEWDALGCRLPVVNLIPTADEGQLVGHLGPDLLGPDWDAGRAISNLVNHPEVQLGLALLDQSLMAGLGNLYRLFTMIMG